MVNQLPTNLLVNATITIQPQAAPRRSFGILLIAGDSNIIDGVERMRSYTTLEGVADDFGTSAPEYLTAALYYSQSPKPREVMIGRWLRTATAGLLRGGILTTAEQAMGNWTPITNGGFRIDIDGVTRTVTGRDFSAETNLNGVASVITAGLTGGVVTWDGSRFIVTSSTTGVSSEVDYAIAPLSGTDISAQLKLTTATALAPVPGFAPETPLEAVTAFVDVSGQWYGLIFGAATQPTDAQATAVAQYIQGLSRSRIYGITEQDTRVLDSGYTADIGTALSALNYTRTFGQYSSSSPYAVASFVGRAFTVNFSGSKTTLTMMWKQEPGVIAENLKVSQQQSLATKRYNVFAAYDNSSAITQYGVMFGGAYFDEIHGLDWLKDAIENNVYNLLNTSNKTSQTESGVTDIKTVISRALDQGVTNGLIAAGVWNQDGFGQLERGNYLTQGYYIYSSPIDLQPQADRDARKSPPIQIAVKLAGAIHTVLNIDINVNR
jgi:hypothetical protein